LFLPPPARPVEETRYFLTPSAASGLGEPEEPDKKAGQGKLQAALFVGPAWQFLWDALAKAGSRGMSAQRICQRWHKEAAAQAEKWYQAGLLRKEQGFRQGRKRPRKAALAQVMTASLSLALSPAQAQAIQQIQEDIREDRRNEYLLFGVTGSGKTEVYLRLAAYAREQGKQTIYLVPEISLVPQLVAKAQQWFGGQVAVLHSNLTPSQRFAEWERIRQGQVSLIVGPRSALFAPVSSLGLIIIDEEHENTYKQSEPEPRYDARRTAEALARLWRAPLVRGSATPDLESLYRCEKGGLRLLTLPDRVEGRPMPAIHWINMNKEMQEGHPHPVSRPLLEALRNRKAAGQQAIFLINRRGFHTYVLCRDCGKSLECPRCSIPLTYHRQPGQQALGPSGGHHQLQGRLLCHYCGYQTAMPSACGHCGGVMLQYMGTGTQRVVDYLAKEIPELAVLRLDMDSTGRAGSHMEILKAFQEGKADVLVGTQMVAKGFDFPKVTLSAVLHIDGIINLPDYQSGERAFQLLIQTAGRAGRGQIPGEVMVQTFYPENPVLMLAEAYDYMAFYRNELALRQALGYPPLKKLARILVTGLQEEQVEARLDEIIARCRQSLPPDEERAILWLGPVKAPLERIKNRWRRHLILLAASWAPLSHCLECARKLAAAGEDEPRIILDMEPKSLL
jgi:primosomal protein N' (replication factor Y)